MTEQFSRLQNMLSTEQASTLAAIVSSQTTASESSLLAECVSVTVKNHQVCLELPLGIGSVCVDVPSWVPNGEAARACVSIKTRFGIPVGVKVCVYVAGEEVTCSYFGL